MIETINPTYKVEYPKYGFCMSTNDLDKAKKVESTITKTIEFIETLSKYHSFCKETTCCDGTEKTSYYPKYLFSNYGKLIRVEVRYNSTQDNSYYGKSTTYSSGISESFSIVELYDKVIKFEIESIKKAIEYLEKIYQERPLSHVCNDIFDRWKVFEMIKELKKDIKILCNYF